MYYFFLLMDFYNHVVMRRSTKWDSLPSRTTQCHKSRQKHKKWFRHMVIIFTKSKHTFRTNNFNFQSLQQWRRIQTHFPTDDRGRCKKSDRHLGDFKNIFLNDSALQQLQLLPKVPLTMNCKHHQQFQNV